MHRHCNNTHVNTLKHILLLTLVLATSALCSSCNEEESAIGMGLQDPATLYAGTNDTLYGSAMTLLDDSLMTTNYSLGLLGYVSDNVFGTADASIYTQIACTSESGINYANSTIDSVVLSITVNEFTSNVGRGAVPLHFQVTPLLSPISTDHLYYSIDTIATNSKHFFNGTVYVTPNKDTTTIRLCLNSRANALFEGKTYTKAEFMAAVNGIRIRLVDNRQPVMMTVNFAAQNTKLTVYRQYHESDTTSEALQDGFSISTGARHFNHYRHRYIGDLATFNTNRKDSVNGSQHLYLDPHLDRQKVMDIFQLSRRRVGAAFAQGSEFASLADFIREIGLPTTFTEMGIILDDDTIRAIATSTIITPGCCKQLTPNEIVEILKECK